MKEALEVPAALRLEVYERDNNLCRVCGRFCESPGIHHIHFRSQGGGPSGLHVLENLVVIGWTPGHECHLRYAHGAQAAAFRAALTVVAVTPGVTALQLLRWNARRFA